MCCGTRGASMTVAQSAKPCNSSSRRVFSPYSAMCSRLYKWPNPFNCKERATTNVETPLPHSTTTPGYDFATCELSSTRKSGDAGQPRVAGNDLLKPKSRY